MLLCLLFNNLHFHSIKVDLYINTDLLLNCMMSPVFGCSDPQKQECHIV